MNCLCNFFENNECLIWVIVALIVISALSGSCCGNQGNCGGCGCGCN